ncbi:MAG: hypothetical protein LCI02_27765 [Proteobacteria bacterium]|nr:hypothetical protein [Pseudomonadota bacterium]
MSDAAMSFSQLMKLGRTQAGEQVSEQSRQSLPVPVPAREDRPLRIAFMYCPSQALPGVNRLAPPSQVVWLDPKSGALIAVRAVTPQSFGRQDPPREVLGEFRLPPGMTADQYLALRERLFQLYDLLFPVWVQPSSQQDKVLLQASAREFLQIFGQISEPPLIPYYHSLGRVYFDWVRALAR